jgi:predicted AlkP superfamily phosphohydrolase/phosphomutase
MELAFTLASLLFLGSLAAFVTSRHVRRAVWWGASVAVVLGIWLLAPIALGTHALYPETFVQWLVIVGVLSAFFLTLGTLVSLLLSWPLAAVERLPRFRVRHTQAAPLAWALVVVPLGYLAVAAALEWTVFTQLSVPDSRVLAIGSLAFAAWAAVCWVVYRALASRPVMPGRWIAAALGLVVVAGLARLYMSVHTTRPDEAAALSALTGRPDRGSTGPLLVIGLDGGNWRTLDPLIDEGRLPTMASLVRSGVTGDVQALYPPYWSTPAWASLITGYHQDDLGVYENLGASAPLMPSFELPLTTSLAMNPLLLFDFGLLNAGVIDAAPADRRRLRRPPIWERVAPAGVRTAVVYFPFSYPATGQATYVVSNRAVADIWDMLGIRPGRRDQLVSAQTNALDLLDLLETRVDTRETLQRLLPGMERATAGDEAVLDPPEILRRALEVGERMFRMTRTIVQTDPDLDLVIFYIGDFDSIAHAFWRYKFPRDYPNDPPPAADIDRLGPVLDRYLEYLDGRLGELIAAFPAPPNVLMVSDHGMEASDAVKAWRAWHSPHGMFLAAGPDVARRAHRLDVSYFDVVPTVLDLLDVEQSPDLPGRSVTQRR